MDKQVIHDAIPHRDPFLFIDEIENTWTSPSIVCTKTFSGTEAFFGGHYPGVPPCPGGNSVRVGHASGGDSSIETLGGGGR